MALGTLFKLKQKGINNLFLNIIKDMYSKTELCVKTSTGMTDPFKSEIGVRQGDVLSPNLFKIYINDIVDYISNTKGTDPVSIGQDSLKCLLYADDIVLIFKSKAGLQKCQDAVNCFSLDWHMPINTQKTKVLIFIKVADI